MSWPIAAATPLKRAAGRFDMLVQVFATGSYAVARFVASPWSVSPPATMMRPLRTKVDDEMCEIATGRSASLVQTLVAGSYDCTVLTVSSSSSFPCCPPTA
jgi:hypothetical protein